MENQNYEIILWLQHNQDCWYKRMQRSLQIYEKSPQSAKLCDCQDECPAHPKNRLYHVGDSCIHADGTQHKIKPKMIVTQTKFHLN